MKGLPRFIRVSLVCLAALLVLWLSLWLSFRFSSYPELDGFLSREYSTVLYDRKGRLISVTPLGEGLKREFLPIARMPQAVLDVFIGSEDRRFYWHPGVDPLAVISASIQNLKARRVVRGASTITMQLSRLVSPRRKGFQGKILEAVDALRIESRLTKKEILELWLNAIPFSFQVEGVQSASRTFFGKDASELSLAEICCLAVIPRRPELYNPIVNPEGALAAASRLASSLSLGLSEEELRADIGRTSFNPLADRAPHFSRFVRERLAERLSSGGGRETEVLTSLDLDLNAFLQDRIAYYLEMNKQSRLSNGAAVLVDVKTAEILAYVGSRDFEDKENSGEIDGVRVRNQPGSCLKPFLYSLAIEKGFLPNSILPDIPMDFGGTEAYVPMNFDRRFHGPVRLRVALASSLNVPAVYMAERLGVNNFTDFLIKLGFASLEGQRGSLGTGLALGNAEVSLYEMTQGFSVFPRGGGFLNLSYRKAERGAKSEEKPVMRPYTAAIICSILSDSGARWLGFGRGSAFRTTFPVMFKTGTANQFQEIWALGATPDYAAGVWMGNFSGKTVIGRTGSSIPAAVVREALSLVRREGLEFPSLSGAEKVSICTLSGGLATDLCPSTAIEYLPKGTKLDPCGYHRLVNGKLAVEYPAEFASWFSLKNRSGAVESGFSDIAIVYPNEGAVFYTDPGVDSMAQAVRIEAVGGSGERISVFVDGKFSDELSPPYRWFFPLKKGRHRIEFADLSSSSSVTIEVR